MICNDCNSEPFEVMVKDEMGFATEAIELDACQLLIVHFVGQI